MSQRPSAVHSLQSFSKRAAPRGGFAAAPCAVPRAERTEGAGEAAVEAEGAGPRPRGLMGTRMTLCRSLRSGSASQAVLSPRRDGAGEGRRCPVARSTLARMCRASVGA